MHERLSFYIKADSYIHGLNPLTKLTLILAFVLIAFLAPIVLTPIILIVIGIIPISFVGRVARAYLNAVTGFILPAAGFLFFMQALFQPLEGQELFRLWFLHPTLESVRFAFVNASRIFVMVSSFTLFLLTTHPSDLMSDLTRRGLPPQFAYVIISTLQILPQMQAKAQTIIAAQRSRGLDTESTFAKRLGALFPLVGPLVFGSLVEVEERAIAIEARGFTSTHAKTSLHDVPDTQADKTIRWILAALVIATLAAKLWLA